MNRRDEFELDGVLFEKQKFWKITVTLRDSDEIRTFHVKSYLDALEMKESILSQNDAYFGDNVERCEISNEPIELEVMKFENGSILELIEEKTENPN